MRRERERERERFLGTAASGVIIDTRTLLKVSMVYLLLELLLDVPILCSNQSFLYSSNVYSFTIPPPLCSKVWFSPSLFCFYSIRYNLTFISRTLDIFFYFFPSNFFSPRSPFLLSFFPFVKFSSASVVC